MLKPSPMRTFLFVLITVSSAVIINIALYTLLESILSNKHTPISYYLLTFFVVTGHVLVMILAIVIRSFTKTHFDKMLKRQELYQRQNDWYTEGMQSIAEEVYTFSQLSAHARRMQADTLISSLAHIIDYYEQNEPKNL